VGKMSAHACGRRAQHARQAGPCKGSCPRHVYRPGEPNAGFGVVTHGFDADINVLVATNGRIVKLVAHGNVAH